jgi:hypothetical protein
MTDASDKLARTRLAIIEHVHRRDRRSDDREASRADVGSGQDRSDEGPSGGGPAAWFGNFKRAAASWWRHHPAQMGVELATPLLSAYAKRKPLQYLGIAAALGAVFVVARPWRLISITGLIVALAKSSQLSSIVMSAMSAADFQKDHQPRR